MRRFTDLAALVDDLLARIEGRSEVRRLLTYPGEFPSIAKEDAFLGGLRALEAEGALKVKRARLDGVDTVVHITAGDIDKLYAFRNRTPASTVSRSLLKPVRDMPELPDGAAYVLDLIEASWSRNIAWSGLRQGEVDALTAGIKLAIALGRLREQGGDFVSSDYRTFSRRTTGDSKILERRARLVVELFRRLFLGTDPELALEDDELLASMGLVRFVQPLLLGGSIVMDGMTLPASPFIGLPAEQVYRISVARASYVLLVENYASFVRHCREVNVAGDGLVVYTGGFPARAVLGAVVSLLQSLDCPAFHWGDIDLGGLRIFVHLERALSGAGLTLKPHLMDFELLSTHGILSERVFPPMTDAMHRSAIGELWKAVAEMSPLRELEQEELNPVDPLG